MLLRLTRQKSVILVFTALLSLTIIACRGTTSNHASADRVVKLTRLPTLTRTPLPTLTPTPNSASAAVMNSGASSVAALTATPSLAPANAVLPAASPVAAEQSQPNNNETLAAASPLPKEAAPPVATETPTLPPVESITSAASPAPTPVLENAGWTFASVQLFDDQYEDGLLLHGEMINNTGIAQELYYVSGIFYDAQGQVIADENSTDDYWPFEIIPPGGRMPFGMFVDGIHSAANFDLTVSADPSEEVLNQAFEFLEKNGSRQDGDYCVTGRLRNLGEPLRYNVIIAAVFYDAQDNNVNFGDFYESSPENIVGDQTLDFEICADDMNRDIARYDLRAWGQ